VVQFPNCGGNHQSPIDITNAQFDGTLPLLNFGYPANVSGTLSVTFDNVYIISYQGNTPATVQLGGPGTNNDIYNLAQIRLHGPSEHRINGGSYPMEVQLFHQNTNTNAASSNELLVVSLLFREGPSNPTGHPFFNQFLPLANYPTSLAPLQTTASAYGTVVNLTMVNFDLTTLIPLGTTYYTYKGSLSYPPCNEAANYYVFDQIQEVSGSQFDILGNFLIENSNTVNGLNGYRPIQPLVNRVIRANSLPATAVAPVAVPLPQTFPTASVARGGTALNFIFKGLLQRQ